MSTQAGKGHVPEENLPRYRALASIARRYDGLGNSLSNAGFYLEAHDAWGQANAFWYRANNLRVDL